MRFIISPAKKMNVSDDALPWQNLPHFLDRTDKLLQTLRDMNEAQTQALWRCSDALSSLNRNRLDRMDLRSGLSPAILSYEGIQYQNMAPSVMSERELAYLESRLRILSAFYGVLRPFDGVTPYRLEMQAKICVGDAKDLYSFWGSSLFDTLAEETDIIVNLASVEYAKAVRPIANDTSPRAQVITCLFGTMRNGKLIQRSVEAKAARGTFVRWCAENALDNTADLACFNVGGYHVEPSLSHDTTLVFIH